MLRSRDRGKFDDRLSALSLIFAENDPRNLGREVFLFLETSGRGAWWWSLLLCRPPRPTRPTRPTSLARPVRPVRPTALFMWR